MTQLCRDEDGTEYGWGPVLDYIGVPWEDLPWENKQIRFDDMEDNE